MRLCTGHRAGTTGSHRPKNHRSLILSTSGPGTALLPSAAISGLHLGSARSVEAQGSVVGRSCPTVWPLHRSGITAAPPRCLPAIFGTGWSSWWRVLLCARAFGGLWLMTRIPERRDPLESHLLPSNRREDSGMDASRIAALQQSPGYTCLSCGSSTAGIMSARTGAAGRATRRRRLAGISISPGQMNPRWLPCSARVPF